MITLEMLQDNFYPVEDLGGGLVQCADELPQKTFFTYIQLSNAAGHAPFVVSEDIIDDSFAAQVLGQAGAGEVTALTKAALAPNLYGFSHILYVPGSYHSELKGRRGLDRTLTSLCIPIFESEFSGSESIEDFYQARRHIVPTSRWDRKIAPKIMLRFDNSRTRGGTGDTYVPVQFDTLLAEIDNLVGVADGFIEIVNHRGEVVELLFDQEQIFNLIRNREDATAVQISKEALRDSLWIFLTQ